MWWVLVAAAAPPQTATLHVGIHREAGGVYQVAADGAAGQCAIGPSRVSCPASGPVTFRWAGDNQFALSGASVVEPGDVGVAFVLATEHIRAPERAELEAQPLGPDTVERLFVRTGDNAVPVPSPLMVQDLVGLAEHPKPAVRRVVVDALVPFWRHTASDPFPPSAPELLPGGLLFRMSRDPDWKVRRRIANRIRELHEPDARVATDATVALTALLLDERPPVRRAAAASLHHAVKNEAIAAELSWEYALERVKTPGPPGRAAANTLGRLAGQVEPGPRVDPSLAVLLVFEHHTERTWNVWRKWRAHVPWRADWMEVLLRETVGLDKRLLSHFARTQPGELAECFTRWEPAPPHSARFEVAQRWLGEMDHPALRASLALGERAPGEGEADTQ